MASKYKIITSSMFKRDLKNVVEYIGSTLLNPTAADNLLMELSLKENILSIIPTAFPRYVVKNKKKFIYHKINIKNYSIFYTIQDNIVVLRRFLYSKRNFDNLL